MGTMALTALAMASAAQVLRPVEPSNYLCRSRFRVSNSRSGVVCKKNLGLVSWNHLRWNVNASFLARSSCSSRQRRWSHAGGWSFIQLDIRQIRGGGRLRSAVTDLSAAAQNELETHGETVASEAGVSDRPKKVRSSGSNGSSGGSKKKFTDGEHLNLKVDGFVTDYSDSDMETDVEDMVYDSEEGSDFTRMRSSTDASSNGDAGGVRQRSSGAEEIDLRFMFLEAIMERARKGDIDGVEEAMSGMSLAGLDAGPRAYHGLVVAYTRVGDSEGALQALKKAFVAGAKPLPESMVSVVRLFGTIGQPKRGKEILAAMEKLNYNVRVAWLTLVEELFNNDHLLEADDVFIEGLEGGLQGTHDLFDRLVEANCKVGDHGNAISILRLMEYGGRMSTTFHYNCLLMAQCLADVPDIVAMTFESMQSSRDEMKPDTESYNWVIQSHIRHKFGDRCQEVIDVLGEMVEAHATVQPNLKTYALLVECFTKYDHLNEAVRHFRALARHPGATAFLFNEGHGRETDPLSLYLRGLCLEGRVRDMFEALEAMVRDSRSLPARALVVNKKGRTLVSSWIEPLQQEPDLGYDIDYVARFLAEGGGAGTRQRYSSSIGGAKAADDDGFAYAAPLEVSYKGFLTQLRRTYNLRLLRKLRQEGVRALGPGATEADVQRVAERLLKDTKGEMGYQVRKPKAASKMLVSELKEELDAQGLPVEGTRPVLYQRVRKARRINKARGRPLWLPASEEEAEERNDEEIDIFMERLNLKNENTEFWRRRFTGGEDVLEEEFISRAATDSEDETFTDDDDDEDDEDDLQVEDSADDPVEDGGEEEEEEPTELLAMQLLKNKKDVADKQIVKDQERDAGEWLGLSLGEKITMLKDRGVDSSELYTIADVWGWTWEQELREREPEDWSQEKEVQLAIDVMLKVQALGGTPTIGDMGTLVRAAIRTPWSEALVFLLLHSHKLGYVFGSNLYAEAVRLCLSLGEKDAAIKIISAMEEVGVAAPEGLPTDVLEETQSRQLADDLGV